MIPICETTLDINVGQNTVKLKYLIDRDRQIRYTKLSRREQAERDSHRQAAADAIGPGATEDQIREKTIELFVAARNENPGIAIEQVDEYIDLFVVGWDYPVPFPSDGRPSALFPLYAKYALYEVVRDNLDELTGLTVDEGKN